MKIAFLGPQASFTQLACSQIFPDDDLIPQSSILDCFNAVKNGEVEKAVVPLENSIEGTVSMTLDYLFDFENICIETEVVMPIAHHLMIHPTNENFEKISKEKKENLTKEIEILNKKIERMLKELD